MDDEGKNREILMVDNGFYNLINSQNIKNHKKNVRMSECQEFCQNVRNSVRMSGKLSECLENCQNVRKTVRIF